MQLNFNEPVSYLEPSFTSDNNTCDVWQYADSFHGISKKNIEKDVDGGFVIYRGQQIFWQSSDECKTHDQACIEFEDDMFDYYFELVTEQEYNTSIGTEELY